MRLDEIVDAVREVARFVQNALNLELSAQAQNGPPPAGSESVDVRRLT
jgi:hypothetical protein